MFLCLVLTCIHVLLSLYVTPCILLIGLSVIQLRAGLHVRPFSFLDVGLDFQAILNY